MNDLIALFVFGTLVFSVLAISIPLFVVIYKQKEAKIKLRHQNEILVNDLRVQEESMVLISEELHDNINQTLGTVRRYINSVEGEISEQRSKDKLLTSEELLTSVIKNVRNISHSLNSDLIRETGLIQSIQKEMEHISDATQIKCVLNIKGEEVLLTSQQNLLLFRIVQEALQNIVKHAEATEIIIYFDYNLPDLILTINDNGKGLDPELAKRKETLGLKNIAKRVAVLNGKWEFSSQPNNGTSLKISFPIKHV